MSFGELFMVIKNEKIPYVRSVVLVEVRNRKKGHSLMQCVLSSKFQLPNPTRKKTLVYWRVREDSCYTTHWGEEAHHYLNIQE